MREMPCGKGFDDGESLVKGLPKGLPNGLPIEAIPSHYKCLCAMRSDLQVRPNCSALENRIWGTFGETYGEFFVKGLPIGTPSKQRPFSRLWGDGEQNLCVSVPNVFSFIPLAF